MRTVASMLNVTLHWFDILARDYEWWKNQVPNNPTTTKVASARWPKLLLNTTKNYLLNHFQISSFCKNRSCTAICNVTQYLWTIIGVLIRRAVPLSLGSSWPECGCQEEKLLKITTMQTSFSVLRVERRTVRRTYCKTLKFFELHLSSDTRGAIGRLPLSSCSRTLEDTFFNSRNQGISYYNVTLSPWFSAILHQSIIILVYTVAISCPPVLELA